MEAVFRKMKPNNCNDIAVVRLLRDGRESKEICNNKNSREASIFVKVLL